jgi:hypothetical protein
MATRNEIRLETNVKRLEREIRIIRAKELETECPPVKFIVNDEDGEAVCDDCEECWRNYLDEVEAGRGSLCREKRINSDRTVR